MIKDRGGFHDKIVLFSGRFDPVHCGHIYSVLKLGQMFKKVLVVILDSPEQRYPITYRKQVMDDILGFSNIEYEVVSNVIHFGKITDEELARFKFDVYAAGNLEVLKHVESLATVETLYVERSYDYTASKILP